MPSRGRAGWFRTVARRAARIRSWYSSWLEVRRQPGGAERRLYRFALVATAARPRVAYCGLTVAFRARRMARRAIRVHNPPTEALIPEAGLNSPAPVAKSHPQAGARAKGPRV